MPEGNETLFIILVLAIVSCITSVIALYSLRRLMNKIALIEKKIVIHNSQVPSEESQYHNLLRRANELTGRFSVPKK